MTLTLPDNIPSLNAMTDGEMKLELAVSLYAARKVTLVQGADLAGLDLFDFQSHLRERRIPQHYDTADLEQDLLVLRDL